MEQPHSKQRHAAYITAGIIVTLSISSIISQYIFTSGGKHTDELHGSAPTCEGSCLSAEMRDADPVYRQAERLRNRLLRTTTNVPSARLIALAIRKHDAQKNLQLHVTTSPASSSGQTVTWTIDLAKHPDLFTFTYGRMFAEFTLNEDMIRSLVYENGFEGSEGVSDIVVTGIAKRMNVMRAETNGVARPGFDYKEANAAEDIINAINKAQSGTVLLSAEYREPEVELRIDGKIRKLDLLSSGVSNFENSPAAREVNVLKALNEHVNNTAIAPGEKFSFNDTLDGPVTLDKGWVEALGLFGGGAAMTPGGGICQAATTVYRAALLAGLPITEKRNHSLYVSYYEKYGVGMDATIFPGVHDLSFRNDTDDWVLVQAYTDGFDAYVNIYGVDDGRTVTMEGPYFVNTRPRAAELRPIGYEEIGWVQRITYADGTQSARPFISHYAKPIAYRSLSAKYAVSSIAETTHAAAPQVEDAGNTQSVTQH